jgi:hypothetical protein
LLALTRLSIKVINYVLLVHKLNNLDTEFDGLSCVIGLAVIPTYKFIGEETSASNGYIDELTGFPVMNIY